MKTGCLKMGSALALALVWLVLLGCGDSRGPFAGTYHSVEPFADHGHIELVLKENGEATWTVGGKSIKLKWRVDDNRIWMYTKEGAIIIATASEAGKMLSADITGEWHPGCPPDKCVNFQRVESAR
jgi:hypothetical protein